MCLSGSKAVLFVWSGLWFLSQSGDSQLGQIYFCNKVPTTDLASFPSIHLGRQVYTLYTAVINLLNVKQYMYGCCLVFNFSTSRMEELTDPELIRQNAKCDRKVSLYGYVRGAHLQHNSRVHIIGNLIVEKNYLHVYQVYTLRHNHK